MQTENAIEASSFHVHDANWANWIVRKIVEARKYMERVEAWAAAEIKRAEREESFFLRRWGPELEAWMRDQIVSQRRKSISLPAGTIGIRNDPAKIVILDEDRLAAWCQTNLPTAIKRTESLLKSVVGQHFNQSGELPPGVEITAQREKFYIR